MRALFKFNNLGLALGMSLKFYTTVAQGLKLKVKVLGANSEIRKSDTGKTVGGDGEGGEEVHVWMMLLTLYWMKMILTVVEW